MATPQKTNLSMVRGDTLAFAIEIAGLDQDLDSAFFSCKLDARDNDYVFQKSLGEGISKVETGKYRVRVAPEDTENIEVGTYEYDLQIGANGDIFTVLKGKLKVVMDITREA